MKKLHLFNNKRKPKVIGWFDDFNGPHPYVALSNFYIGEPLKIPQIDGDFMTGEHAFAYMKASTREEANWIRDAFDPSEAKMRGRQCQLRQDWEAVKYDAMMAVIRAKFTFDRLESEVLLSTGDALLVEGTFWGDSVWGIDLRDDDVSPTHGPGRNWLGTLLMARRAELVAERMYNVSHPTGLFNALFAR